jgi:hypothetical protein
MMKEKNEIENYEDKVKALRKNGWEIQLIEFMLA